MQPARRTMHQEHSVEEHADILRSHGLKATPQRLALLAVLARASKPLSLHAIEAAPETRTVNQSTLYRAVKECIEVGIVRSVDLRHTHAHYELATGPEHHHLICTSCGTVEDFTVSTCSTMEHEALKSSAAFVRIHDHSFELYGTCRQCDTLEVT
jgi:Fe2+ or Zn2+ uptake regulation protein